MPKGLAQAVVDALFAPTISCVGCGKPVPPDAEGTRYYDDSGDILGACCPMTDEAWARECKETH